MAHPRSIAISAAHTAPLALSRTTLWYTYAERANRGMAVARAASPTTPAATVRR
jgi:hypothetical protein